MRGREQNVPEESGSSPLEAKEAAPILAEMGTSTREQGHPEHWEAANRVDQDAEVGFARADEHKVPVEEGAHQQEDDGTEQIGEEDGGHDHGGPVGANQLEPG